MRRFLPRCGGPRKDPDEFPRSRRLLGESDEHTRQCGHRHDRRAGDGLQPAQPVVTLDQTRPKILLDWHPSSGANGDEGAMRALAYGRGMKVPIDTE